MSFGTESAAIREESIPGAVSDTQSVPFFSQARTFDRIWPSVYEQLEKVFDHGKFSHGRHVAELEEQLADYTGARFVVGVNSGTDALVLLLRAAGLHPGDEVIVPAYSFIATATSVVLAGGRPVFADIDPVTYALDPDEVERVASTRTRFVLPAHLFCQMADVAALAEVAERRGLTLVEDSAEAIGMRHGGIHAGLHGSGGVLSFFPSKTLGALGDAGAVLTDDPGVAELVSGLRHHGRFGRTLDHFPGISTETGLVGMNSKMDDVQAAILSVKLSCLDADIDRRAKFAGEYRKRLAGVPGIVRLPEIVGRVTGSVAVFYVYLVEVEHRDELVNHLARCGIGTETYYPVPLPSQPCFAEYGHVRDDFPNAAAASERAVALPLYPDLTVEQVEHVCSAVRAFLVGRCA